MDCLPLEIREKIYKYVVDACKKPVSFQTELRLKWVHRMCLKLFNDVMKDASTLKQLVELMEDIQSRSLPNDHINAMLQPCNTIYNRLCCMISSLWYVSIRDGSKERFDRLLSIEPPAFISVTRFKRKEGDRIKAILLFPEPASVVQAFELVGTGAYIFGINHPYMDHEHTGLTEIFGSHHSYLGPDHTGFTLHPRHLDYLLMEYNNDGDPIPPYVTSNAGDFTLWKNHV